MALSSYFDFAENDFQYFKASYEAGIVANMMGAMAQGICEKYMKHLVSEYWHENAKIPRHTVRIYANSINSVHREACYWARSEQ